MTVTGPSSSASTAQVLLLRRGVVDHKIAGPEDAVPALPPLSLNYLYLPGTCPLPVSGTPSGGSAGTTSQRRTSYVRPSRPDASSVGRHR